MPAYTHEMFLNSQTLASLRFFATAARTLSFKQAALELHVTQGALSHHIRQLEKALGRRLFTRMPRQVSLTVEGSQLAAVAQRALEDLERGAAAVAEASKPSEVRLRAGPSFAIRWLVPRLGNFYARHRDTRLFVNAVFGELASAHQDFDLAIELLKVRPRRFQAEPFMEETLIPVCSREYYKLHESIKKPKDLANCVLLHDAQPWPGAREDAEWRHWLDRVGATNVDSRKGQFFSLADMSLEAALRHQGMALGRASLIGELLASGALVRPFRHEIKSPTRYYLVYEKERASLLQNVIRWLKDEVRV
jgi:DNA-binding transcriptional LysR family regulator